MSPGVTAVTVTPVPASSAWRPSASPTAPNFATEYGHQPRHGDEAAHRRDDADPAVPGIPHRREHGEREVHRPPEHRVDRVLVVAQGQGVGMAHLDDARDVDRDVDPALGADDLVDQGRDRVLVAHVTGAGDEARAGHGGREEARGRLQLGLVAGAPVDDVAAREQLLGDEQAQPARGAQDERDARPGRIGPGRGVEVARHRRSATRRVVRSPRAIMRSVPACQGVVVGGDGWTGMRRRAS